MGRQEFMTIETSSNIEFEDDLNTASLNNWELMGAPAIIPTPNCESTEFLYCAVLTRSVPLDSNEK